MTRTVRLASALTVAALALAGCGSTRFVVVENGTSAPAGADAAPASGTPSTTAGTTGAPSAEDERAIRTTIAKALAVDDTPMRERLPYLEPDAEDLAETYTAVRKIVAGLSVELDVTDVAATGADTAIRDRRRHRRRCVVRGRTPGESRAERREVEGHAATEPARSWRSRAPARTRPRPSSPRRAR